MKLLRGCVAALAMSVATLALAAVTASAAPSFVNPGFESGSTAGWHGNGSATRDYAGFTAPAGSYFGLVRSPGCPGQQLEQHFTASEGDVVTGWAFFHTDDALPFDDDGEVAVEVEQTGTRDVVFGSRVSEVGDHGATPWSSFEYTIPHTGSYRLRLQVENALDCGQESAVGLDMSQRPVDDDTDGIIDEVDNCPDIANADQLNQDDDGQGDACDADDDNDGVDDDSDNCRLRSNSAQTDADGDTQGDACDADDDNDAVNDSTDNCPLDANTEQPDNDADRHGDACDADDDDDGVMDALDNCPLVANPGQPDDDQDGVGNSCDDEFDSSEGKAGGGGWIATDGGRLHFSVSATSRHGVVDGACTMTLRQTKIRCVHIDGYYRDPQDDRVLLAGTMTIDGTSTTFTLVMRDSGHDDRFRLTTDSGFEAHGDLGGGNIQIRAR